MGEGTEPCLGDSMPCRAAAVDLQDVLKAPKRVGALRRRPRRSLTPRRSIELPNGLPTARYVRWGADPLTSTGLGADVGAGR